MSHWRVAVTCLTIFQACSIYGQSFMKSSLAIVLDSTGSMVPEISQLNNNVDRMFANKINNSPIENFVLVTFSDPTSQLLTVTNNREEFKNYSMNITAEGGGYDCPEYAMTGIKTALQNCIEGSILYVITDASASDVNMYDEIRSLALKKQTQLNFIITGDCSSRDSPEFEVYYKLAKDTVGEVFSILKSEVSDIFEYVIENIKSRRYLMAYETVPSAHDHKINFTVDNFIDDVIISITSPNNGKIQQITTIAPDGKPAENSSIFLDDQVAIMRLLQPKIGEYVTMISNEAETFIKITGNTSIHFQCGFSQIMPTSLIETASRPAAVGNSYLSIQLYADGYNLTTARVLDLSGNTLEELSLRSSGDDQNFYVSKAFDPPRTLFRIAVDGYDIQTETPITRKSAVPFERRNRKTEKLESMVPKVTIEKWPKIITKYNVTYKLKCKAEGFPTPLILWQEKDSGKILQAEYLPIEEPFEFISILNIGQPIKNASYECIARDNLNNIKKDIQIEVDTYFIIVQAPEDCMKVNYEQEVSIFCKVDALPPATIIWYKDKSVLTNDSNTLISKDNSSVTIKQMNFKTKGVYRCEVKHELDNRVFYSHLNLIGTARPIIMKTQSKLHILNGNDVDLICRIYDEVIPKPTIYWIKPRDFSNVYEENNETSNILHLKNVTGDQSGTYACIAANYEGTDFYDIDLIIDYPPTSIKNVTPIVAKEGTIVSVSCNVYGVPSPNITWFHNSNSVKTTNDIIITAKNNLKFININLEDAGNYTCVAQNQYGSLAKTYNVEVYTPIYIRIPDISARSVIINQTLILNCDAYGYPKPQINWVYNDFHGKLRMQKLRFDKISKSYFIIALKLKDEGFYTCIARNKYDSSKLTYEITVNAPPMIRPFYPERTFYAVNGDMTLKIRCVATGNPKPEIIWTRQNFTTGLGNEDFDGQDGYLVIKNVSKASQGDYSCWAKNKLGNYSLNFKVIVEDYPKPNVLNATKILTKGNTIELQCSSRFTKLDIVRWYKGRQQLTNDNKFILPNASVKDSGIYSCHFSNITLSYSLHFDIIIQDEGVSFNQR